MKTIKESGFSLVEILVATAIWSILALGISYTIISQKKQEIIAEENIQAIDMGHKLSNYVNSSVFCEAVLSSTKNADSRRLSSTWRNLDIRNNKFTIHDDETLSAGSQLDHQGNIRVTQARYRVKPGSQGNERRVVIGSKDEVRRIAQIQIGLGLYRNNELIKSLEPTSIEVPVMTKNEFITSCELKVTEPEICSALGMNFDMARSVCEGEGDLGCDFLGSYTKAALDETPNLTPTCNGADSELVNSVTGNCSCPAGTNEERSFGPTATDAITINCGKKCDYTVYTKAEVIGCFKCGGN